MTLDEDAISQFVELVEKWAPGFRKIIRTFLAFKREGEWCLEHSTTTLYSNLAEDTEAVVKPMTVETPSILAVREIIDCDENVISSFLSQVRTSPFMVPFNGQAIFVSDRIEDRYTCFFEPMTRREFPGPWRWPAVTISAQSQISFESFPRDEQLDIELLSHDIPFKGLEDLFNTFGIPDSCKQANFSSPTSIFTVSNPAILLPESSMSDESAHIKIKCADTMDPSDISVGIRAFQKSHPPIRTNITSEQIEWTKDGTWLIGESTKHIADAAFADVHLNYKNEFLGHYWVNDPAKSLNQRFLLHRLFDKKDVVGDAFFAQKADYFEDAISLLLNLLGLTAITYGGIPALKDAPDILASSTFGHLFVIECTTTDISRSGKLLKLSQRTKEIIEAVQVGGLEYGNIQPVMCTSLPRAETKASWDEAAEFGISLLCKEDIQSLINGLEVPRTPQELFTAIMTLIPKKDDRQNTLP